MTAYKNFEKQYTETYNALHKKYNLISAVRLLVALVMIGFTYQAFRTGETVFIVAALLSLIAFIVLMKIHSKIAWNRKIQKNRIFIVQEEISYLNKESIPFENGVGYTDFQHFYAYDLDFFGAHSLFHNLNRTATYIGSKSLSNLLLSPVKNDTITANQAAIKELAAKPEWRHALLAIAKVVEDKKENYERLIAWSKVKQEAFSKPFIAFLYLMPTLFCASFFMCYILGNEAFSSPTTLLFLVNLSILLSQYKKIKKEIIDGDEISDIIKQYGLILEKIENEHFVSEKLLALQTKLQAETGNASANFTKLATLFHDMQSIQNPIGAALFNGSFLYHAHTLKAILNWKKNYATHTNEWLNIIGEFEALNSLANYAYNNPTFIYPTLNTDFKIEFEALGHPLIAADKRICNDVSFHEQRFIILTGSNMSGKSTFLRTLGMNMVLAGIGAPICATRANIHPLDVVVSMRQADSLTDSESYFFAEVKRLKKIIDKLENKTCFVLLDEILKGTNSDDKQTGTIEVIKKIISKNAIGAIATHDLDVCQTTDDYPKTLTNKCFEVEIINNELDFDYRLRDGICQNKSATFLMEKMGVI